MPEYENTSQKIYNLLSRVRENRPLIHVVTNFVVMNQTANALLALGAAPTMSWAKEDARYMSAVSDGLCVNIGTPVKERIDIMEDLMRLAEETKKPLVLDPVGSGAGPYRTGIARELLLLAPHKIIRGNASEICSLITTHQTPRGVDNTTSLEEAKQILIGHGRTDGRAVSLDSSDSGIASILPFASAVIVSGQKDMILGHDKVVTLGNGSPIMNLVTGTGCILSAVTSAFYAVSQDGVDAAVAATSVVGIAGELASKKASGPGTFMAHFLDALYVMDADMIHTHLKLEFQKPGFGE